MFTDFFLPAVLVGSVLLGASLGWWRGTSERRFPRLYWNGMTPNEEWLTLVDRTGRRERWLTTLRYAFLAPILAVIVLSVAAFR
jgi:hypothetical protein